MAYYSAHYGAWNEPGGVQRVEFGREKGIDYLFETYDYRAAIEAAQEAANESGQIVHFCKTIPVAGRGLKSEWRKLYPVRSKIKFVRMYKMYRENWYDVIYHSGRVCTYLEPDLPTTVEKFVESSTIREQQHDKMFNRDEMIYY